MTNRVETYLMQVAKQLKGLPLQQRDVELREIESHLRSMIEARQLDGVPDDRAVSESLHQFGSAKRVGRTLKRAWQSRQPEQDLQAGQGQPREDSALAGIAFIFAALCQVYLSGDNVFFAYTFWFSDVPDLLRPLKDPHTLLPLLLTPVLVGFFTSVIAPQKGRAAALSAYGAVIAFYFFISFTPAFWYGTARGDFLRLLANGLVLLPAAMIGVSVLGILSGARLSGQLRLRWTGRHQKLQPVGGPGPNAKGDNYGS